MRRGGVQTYLALNVLPALKLWLDPLDDKKKAASLPNKTLILKVAPAHPARCWAARMPKT